MLDIEELKKNIDDQRKRNIANMAMMEFSQAYELIDRLQAAEYEVGAVDRKFDDEDLLHEEIATLRAQLAELEKQEPVAYMRHKMIKPYIEDFTTAAAEKNNMHTFPVYANPVPVDKLTNEDK